MKNIELTKLLIFSCIALLPFQAAQGATAPANQPMIGPMQPGMQPGMGGMGMPQLSPAELETALQEIDSFFKNMSEEEMKDFTKFMEDIETGKIDINELLPPGMGMPAPQRPAQPVPQPAQEPKEAPLNPKEPVAAEKPKIELRNKKAAQAMIQSILDRLGSLRLKAASYAKVADTLKPWNQYLDTLVYYLHTILKKEHIEQLVTDKELIPLHDALRDLNDTLTRQEQYVQVPEFGLEKQDVVVTQRSKNALKSILSSFDTAFKQRMVIADLEKLLKKYEPEFLKIRKEMEAQEERALKEAEGMKSWRMPESRITSERTYATTGGRFYDWLYTGDRKPSPSRAYETKPKYEGGRSFAEPSATRPGGEAAGAGKAEDKGKDKEEEEKKGKAGKEGKEAKAPAPTPPAKAEWKPSTKDEERVARGIKEIESVFEHIEEYLEEPFLLGKPGLQVYLVTPAVDVALADKINAAFEQLTQALHTIAKKGGDLEARLRKLAPAAQQALAPQLKQVVMKGDKLFSPLYEAIWGQVQRIHRGIADGRMSADKAYLHFGYKKAAGNPSRAVLSKPVTKDYFDDFLTAYEIVFRPSTQAQRKVFTDAILKIEKPGATAAPTTAAPVPTAAPTTAPAAPAGTAPVPAPAPARGRPAAPGWLTQAFDAIRNLLGI